MHSSRGLPLDLIVRVASVEPAPLRTAGPGKGVAADAVKGVDPSVQESDRLSVPPSDVKGRIEKLPTDSAEQSGGND